MFGRTNSYEPFASKYFFNHEKTVAEITIAKKIAVLEKLENKTTREAEKILLAKATAPVTLAKEKVRQITEQISEIKFNADEKLLVKINRLKGLLAHKKENMNLTELLNTVCEIALDKLDPVRKSRPSKPENLPNSIPPAPKVQSDSHRPPQVPPPGNTKAKLLDNSRRKYISVNIKREVWQSAHGNCQNCGSTYALEIDHITPRARGGQDYRENLRLLCRSCNQRQAIKKLGPKVMLQYIR